DAMSERPDRSSITSPRSERVRKVAALSGRSARRKQKRFRVEGPQAIRSLLTHRADLALELLITARRASDHPQLLRLAATAGVPVREVAEQIVRALVREQVPAAGHRTGDDADARSGTGMLVSPQGAVAVGRLPVEDAQTAATALAELPASG